MRIFHFGQHRRSIWPLASGLSIATLNERLFGELKHGSCNRLERRTLSVGHDGIRRSQTREFGPLHEVV